MIRPNEELMQRYGTEVDFQEKEAGLSPLAKRMLFAMAASRAAQGWDDSMNQQRAEAMAMNDAFQALQQQKLGLTIAAARHSTPPVFAPPDQELGYMPYPVPLGMDAGMVRVASAIGAELAHLDKEAGIMSGLAGLMERKAPQLARGFGRIGGALKAPVGAVGEGLASAGHGLAAGAKLPVVGKAVGRVGGAVEARGVGLMRNAGNLSSNPAAMQVSPQAAARMRLSRIRSSEAAAGRQAGSFVPHVQTAAERMGGAAKSMGRGALAAGLVGAGALGLGAYALAKPTLGYLSKEQKPANWGETDYGAPQLAYGVNQYGYPQLGTPFMR